MSSHRATMFLIALMFTTALMAAAASQDQTGAVSGVVTQLGVGTPLRGAQVTLTPLSGGPPRNLTTDAEGRFLFDGLAPGNLRITVSRDGYFAPAELLNCPQTGSTVSRFPVSSLQSTATTCVSLQPSQRVDNLAVTLIPGGTIRGRILDPDGKPAVGATVQAIPVQGPGVAQTTQTNDRGEFRLYWVAPASYIVGVTPKPPSLPPAPNRTPVATYFPGAVDSADALELVVTPGSDQNTPDFSIRTATTLTISGRILTTLPPRPTLANGRPAPLPAFVIHLIPRAATVLDPAVPLPAINSSPNRTQGEFEIRGVRPGPYDIVALMTDENRRQHVGRVGVEVGTVNVGNVLVQFQLGVNVSGKTTLSPRLRLISPQMAQRIQIQLTPMGASPGMSALMSRILPSVLSDPSGNFAFPNVPSGRYRVSPEGLLYVTDIRDNGATVLQEGLQVSERPVDGLEVVLDESADVRLTVRDTQQQPLANATVLLIPDAARRGDRSLFKVGKTNSIGRLVTSGILPGEYRISIWADAMPPLASFDEKALDSIEPFSVPIHAAPGTDLELVYTGSLNASPVVLSTGRKRTESRPIQLAPADAAQASIEGRVWKGSQQSPGATVVLIPEGPRRTDPSQFKTVTTSGAGYFVFRGGLSGRYTVMAFENLLAGVLENAEFLAEQEQKSRAVYVNPAGSVSVQLNLIPK